LLAPIIVELSVLRGRKKKSGKIAREKKEDVNQSSFYKESTEVQRK